MKDPSYPRPVCAICGMRMTLNADAQKWFCESCNEFTTPTEPSRIEPVHPDPAKPKWRWVKFAIVVCALLIIMFLRMQYH